MSWTAKDTNMQDNIAGVTLCFWNLKNVKKSTSQAIFAFSECDALFPATESLFCNVKSFLVLLILSFFSSGAKKKKQPKKTGCQFVKGLIENILLQPATITQPDLIKPLFPLTLVSYQNCPARTEQTRERRHLGGICGCPAIPQDIRTERYNEQDKTHQINYPANAFSWSLVK